MGPDKGADSILQDPGAITLGWALFELARTPQVVAQLRAEIVSK